LTQELATAAQGDKSVLWRRVWNAGLAVLVGTVFLVLLIRTAPDPDLWGHLRFGLDILESGQLVQDDRYSYLTSGQEWINHEWLSEVSFAGAWIAGGTGGLVLLKALFGGITFGILYAHLLWLRIHPLRASMLLLFYSLGVFPYLHVVRPQIYTYLLFLLVLIVLYRAEHGSYRWLWSLPLLAALWVNLHGGLLAGLAIVGTWAVIHLVLNRRAWARVIPPLLVSLPALLINPYGYRLIVFLLTTATFPRPDIADWQPLHLIGIDGLLWCLAAAPAVAGFIYSSRPRRIPLLVIFALVALSPWFAIRNLPLFCIGSLVLAGEHIASAWERALPYKHQERHFRPVAATLPFFLAGTLIVLAVLLGFGSIEKREENYPLGAVALIQQSGITGNLAVHFDWGEYTLWHLGPRVKVSLDGRRETVYSQEIYKANGDFMAGVNDWDALIEEHPTDMALVKPSDAVYNLLHLRPDWTEVYTTKTSALFVRRDSPQAGPLQRAAKAFTPPGATGYFP
jgi:hypothetical protein